VFEVTVSFQSSSSLRTKALMSRFFSASGASSKSTRYLAFCPHEPLGSKTGADKGARQALRNLAARRTYKQETGRERSQASGAVIGGNRVPRVTRIGRRRHPEGSQWYPEVRS
jgi:hypothetical protein